MPVGGFGVLVSARVNAKRLAGADEPRIAVLRPAGEDDISVTVAGFAPLPVVTAGASVHEAQDLHLRIEPGDSIGFLLPSGQVDLGLRTRRQPDGAVQWFTEPCSPCHMDGGTGREGLPGVAKIHNAAATTSMARKTITVEDRSRRVIA